MTASLRSLACVVFVTLLFNTQLFGVEQSSHEPVVFIHGLCSDSDTWTRVRDVMQDRGWIFGGALKNPMDTAEMSLHLANADFYLLNFEDQIILGGIESWAVELQLYLQRINQFRVQHGVPSSKFTIVSHSAGGLAARYYLQKRYRDNVGHLITYGTPHLGATSTMFGKLAEYVLTFLPVYFVSDSPCLNPILWEESPGVAEMDPNSEFLTDLNSQPFPSDVQYTALIGDYSVSSACQESDCVVSTSSQDISHVSVPPREGFAAARTFANRTHTAETSDAEGVLWALDRLAGVPKAPRNLTALPGSSTVSLVWDPPESGPVSSYVVEAGSSSGAINIAAFDTGDTATRYGPARVDNGTYFMRVRAKNQIGIGSTSNEVSFTIGKSKPNPPNRPPTTGSILMTPGAGVAAFTGFTFTAQGVVDPDGDRITYKWNFGDGTTAIGQSVAKTYSAAGTYIVKLVVSDGHNPDVAADQAFTIVRTLTGVWTGIVRSTVVSPPLDFINARLNITQSGRTLSVICTGIHQEMYNFAFAPGSPSVLATGNVYFFGTCGALIDNLVYSSVNDQIGGIWLSDWRGNLTRQ